MDTKHASPLIQQLQRLYASRETFSRQRLLQLALQHVTETLNAEAGCLWILSRRDAYAVRVYTDNERAAEFEWLRNMQAEGSPFPAQGLVPREVSDQTYWLLRLPFHSPISLAYLAFSGSITPPSQEILEAAAGLLVLLFHKTMMAQAPTPDGDDVTVHQLQHYRLLNEALNEINRSQTVPAMLRELHRTTLKLLKADCGAILYQEPPLTITTPVEIGDKHCLNLLNRLQSSRSAADPSFKDALVHIVEAQDMPSLAGIAQQLEVHTILALPIHPQQKETRGTLLLCRQAKAAFSEQERALATIMTHQTALIIHNTHLLQQEQEQHQLAEAMAQAAKALTRSLDLNQVLDEILAQLDRVVPHDASNVMFIEGEQARVVRRHGYRHFIPNAENMKGLTLPLDLPDLEVMIKTRRTILIPNTVKSELWTTTESSKWIHSFIGAPIVIGDEVIGFVNVDSATPNYFSETHAHRLETFTDYVALAVQNARLFHESQQRQRVLQDLNVVTAAVNSTMPLTSILQKGLRKALKITDLHYGGIYLWNESARTLRLNVHEALPEEALDQLQIRRTSDTLIGRAFVHSEPTWNAAPASTEPPASAADLFQIALPLVVESRPIGVLALGADHPISPLESCQQHLQTISDQLALAVRREQLSQQLREQLQALQYLYEASTGLMTQMDMQDALFILLRTLCDVLPRALGAAFYQQTDNGWQRTKVYARTGAPSITSLWQEGDVGTEEIAFLDSCGQERVPVIVSERRGRDIAFWQQARQADAQRLVYMPLILPTGEMLGIAGMISADKKHLSSQSSALIQALLQEGAAAISRIRLYEQTRREESQMRAILEASQDGTFLIGNDGNVRYVNKRALDVLHMPKSRSYWEGQSFDKLTAFIERENAELAQWLTEHAIAKEEPDQPVTAEDGDVIFEASQGRKLTPNYRYVYSAQEKLLGVLLLIRDVTEQQAMKRMRDDLLHMLVHDMRNPLSVIINALYMLQDPDTQDLSPKINRLALSNAEQVLTLINAILDINKLESGQFDIEPEATHLAPLLDDLNRQVLTNEKNVIFKMDFSEDLPQAFVDPEVIRRVFQNLTDNAFKFIPTQKGLIRVSARQKENQIEVEVFNNGPPIPPDVKSQLFIKFTTGSYRGQGYGLGLAFCRLAVEAHGGEIWVENRSEGGVSFYFTLPVAD